MKTKKSTVLIAILLLSGCGNLQTHNVDNRQYIYSEDGRIKFPAKPIKVRTCPMYHPPEPEATPPAPIQEYRAMKAKTAKDLIKREEILLAYIEQLRKHISAQNKLNVDAYRLYLQNCEE